MAVKGNFNLFGYNLPDFGFSERVPFLRAFDNPRVTQQPQPRPYIAPMLDNNYTPPIRTGNQVIPGTYLQTQQVNPFQGQPAQQVSQPQQQQQQQQSGPSAEDLQRQREQEQLMQQIEASYNPSYAALNEQEAFMRNTQLPNSLAQLQTQKQDLLSDLDVQRAGQERLLASQRQELGDNSRSAYDQALRGYQALQQQGNARFGTGSSAGQAVGELAQKEFYRTQGNVQMQQQKSLQELQNREASLGDMIMQTTNKINRSVVDQQRQIESEFQTRLMEISARKGELESAKSQAKLELLNEAIARARDLRQKKEIALFNLSLVKAEEQAGIDSQFSLLQQQNQQFDTNPFYQPQQSIGQQQQGYISPSQLIGSRSPRQDDEFNRIINPFA